MDFLQWNHPYISLYNKRDTVKFIFMEAYMNKELNVLVIKRHSTGEPVV